MDSFGIKLESRYWQIDASSIGVYRKFVGCTIEGVAMRRLAAALFSSAIFVGSAFAADLPAKMYTKAPIEPLYNWTGFYVGGNLGYSWGRTSTDYTTVGAGTETHRDSINMNGVIGGGQIGYNYQFNKS